MRHVMKHNLLKQLDVRCMQSAGANYITYTHKIVCLPRSNIFCEIFNKRIVLSKKQFHYNCVIVTIKFLNTLFNYT